MDGSLERPDKSSKAEVASRSSQILPFGFFPLPLSLFLFLPVLSCAISIHTFLELIGLEALQRDLNRIISLLLSHNITGKTPLRKADKMGQKMCGKWGKASQTELQSATPLWKDPGVFIHCCRTLTFLAWPPEVSRKETELSSGKPCWIRRSWFQVLKCNLSFFATMPHRATQTKWGSL